MRSLRAMWLVTAMSFRVSPWQSMLALVEVLGRSLVMLQPLFLMWLIDGVATHHGARLVLGAAGFVASIALNMALQLVGTHARVIQFERVGFEFDEQTARLTSGIPTLDHLESARYQDQLQVLRDQQGTLGSAFNSVLNTVRNLVYAVGTILVATTADWRLAILLLVAVPGLLVTRWTVRWDKQGEDESADPARRAGHFIDLLTKPTPSAELRMLGVRDHIRGLLGTSVASWRRPIVRAELRTGAVRALDALLFFGAAALVIAWMVRDAIGGDVSPGTVGLAVLVIGRLQQTVALIRSTMQQVTRLIRNVGRFTWLQDYADRVSAEHPGRKAPPARLRDGIGVRGLTYRYEGAAHDSLTDVNLDLPAGAVVALVGENGAGKSTLVKLLTGMYLPTGGAVHVDGTDLRELDAVAWRERISGAFQDYARFELSALESVGLGDVAHLEDKVAVLAAMHAGAADGVLRALPEGLDTQLGSTWPGGVDLSGGQWQRLALARAMMRQDPLLLVLDEPTASLDAATEHALFERYAAAARSAGGGGAVTLLVTHRFSTVAAADLVVVLEAGRVVEVGTHSALMAARGHYAELYELQARGYR